MLSVQSSHLFASRARKVGRKNTQFYLIQIPRDSRSYLIKNSYPFKHPLALNSLPSPPTRITLAHVSLQKGHEGCITRSKGEIADLSQFLVPLSFFFITALLPALNTESTSQLAGWETYSGKSLTPPTFTQSLKSFTHASLVSPCCLALSTVFRSLSL